MKIAIVAYNHPESSITLTKYLAEESNTVDFYFITTLNQTQVPCLDLSSIKKRPGLQRVNIKDVYSLNSFFKGVNNISINLIRVVGKSRFSFINKIIIFFVCRNIKSKKYDVVNIIGQNELLINVHSNLRNQNKVHSFHEIDKHYLDQKISQSLVNYIAKSNTSVIVHSQYMFDQIVEKEIFKKDNVYFIPFGLFEPYLHTKKRLKDNFNIKNDNVILFYGFIRPYKGIDVIIESLDGLSSELVDFKVVIAGDGYLPDKSKLINDNRIELINRRLSDSEIIELNQKAKIIVCPYKSASQSGIVMTTFLFGKPIIASNVGAFKETITDGVNGILVIPNSVDDFTRAVVQILKNNSLYDRLSKNVLKFNKNQDYQWKSIAKKTINLYKKICGTI